MFLQKLHRGRLSGGFITNDMSQYRSKILYFSVDFDRASLELSERVEVAVGSHELGEAVGSVTVRTVKHRLAVGEFAWRCPPVFRALGTEKLDGCFVHTCPTTETDKSLRVVENVIKIYYAREQKGRHGSIN